jgi:hypothetical protein
MEQPKKSTYFSKSDSAEDKLVHSTRTICVTVDTEEEGLWGGSFPVRNCTTENLRGLERFQNLCDKYSLPPTYLIDAPVLEDRRAVNDLKEWMLQGRCELGAHTHPWCNPPIVLENVSNRDSFFCNLPNDLQFEKLKWLTDRITDVFDQPPRTYRAGRYGFSTASIPHLCQLGYVLDSSVLPFFDYSAEDGPDYRQSARHPQLISDPVSKQSIWELPVSTGFSSPGFYSLRKRLWRCIGGPLGRKTKLAGLGVRFGLTRHLKLSPEGTELKELKGLVDGLVRDGINHLVLMLHSTSLMPGFSPYCKTPEALENLYDRLEKTLQHAIEHHHFQGAALLDVATDLNTTFDLHHS